MGTCALGGASSRGQRVGPACGCDWISETVALCGRGGLRDQSSGLAHAFARVCDCACALARLCVRVCAVVARTLKPRTSSSGSEAAREMLHKAQNRGLLGWSLRLVSSHACTAHASARRPQVFAMAPRVGPRGCARVGVRLQTYHMRAVRGAAQTISPTSGSHPHPNGRALHRDPILLALRPMRSASGFHFSPTPANTGRSARRGSRSRLREQAH